MTTQKIKLNSYGLGHELYTDFVTNGLEEPHAIEGIGDAWVSLAHKIKKDYMSFEITPEEAKELRWAVSNIIDIQQDHMDDAEGRGIMRAAENLLHKL